MNILLTHGYFLNKDPHESRIMKPYVPLGLLYLSAWLKKEGFSAEVFDTTFRDPAELEKKLKKSGPGVIGLYSTLMTKGYVLSVVGFIRQDVSLRNSVVIVGGPDARFNAENYLRHGVDIVVPGEGEQALTDTMKALTYGGMVSLPGVKGIVFLNMDGKVMYTGEPSPLDPDELPLPAREQIDFSPYLERWKVAHGYFPLSISSMRGCPYSCKWCSKSVFGQAYRRRNPELVVKEMIEVGRIYNPDRIWFTDDVFTISREWTRKFAKEVARQGLDLPYECITRSDCLDDEILQLLRESGSVKLWIGAESGSQAVIDLMDRKINIEKTISVLKRSKATGISTGSFIMLGYPGEGKKDIFKTGEFLGKALPDEVTLAMAYPIRGTSFYDIAEEGFQKPYDWESGDERSIRFRKPFSDRFYRFAIRYLFNLYKAEKTERFIKRIPFRIKAFLSKIYLHTHGTQKA